MSNEIAEKTLERARRNLRVILALRDLNRKEVSESAGLSANALGTFLNGKSSMSYANISAVCHVLRIPISILSVEGGITENRIRLHDLIASVPEGREASVLRLVEEFAADR